MKKILILISSAAMLVLTGCNDFLSLTPRNIKVMTTVEDYRDLMASYMTMVKRPNPDQQMIFGDYYVVPTFCQAYPCALYSGEVTLPADMFFDPKTNLFTPEGVKMQTWLVTDNNYLPWNKLYKFLGPINLIIKEIQVAEGNDEQLRQYVLGEALVWRAYSYFKLLQHYAPYKDSDMGIPMYLDPTDNVGNAMPKRETQKVCYDQIINDLMWAKELSNKTILTSWTLAFKSEFINAMLASVYNYKAMSGAAESTDWANAVKYADVAIGSRQLANSTDVLKAIFNINHSTGDIFIPINHAEFTFRIADGFSGQLCKIRDFYYAGGGYSTGLLPKEYNDLFQADDIRRQTFISAGKYDKYNLASQPGFYGGGGAWPYRLAESMLIKAEALARQGNTAEAKAVLEMFCAKRYPGVAHVVPADQTALIKEIMSERKREFYQEGDIIWLDMKRTQQPREITVSGTKYRLEGNDFRYSFPIPADEIRSNKNMIQNPGWAGIVM